MDAELSYYFSKVIVKVAGEVIESLTTDSIRLDLEALVWHERTGVPITEERLMRIGRYIQKNHPTLIVDGKIDVKQALNVLAQELKEFNEAPSSEKDGPVDTSRIFPAFHAVFDMVQANKLEINTLMTLAVQKMNVPFSQWIEEKALMRKAISQDSSSDDPTFFSTARAIGDVIRIKNAKGKPTGEEKPAPLPFEEGKAKGKAVPRYSQYRWTKKFIEVGIISRHQFDNLVDWIGGRAPTEHDAKRYLEHLKAGASVPDSAPADAGSRAMAEEEEETQEQEASPLPTGYVEVSNRKRG